MMAAENIKQIVSLDHLLSDFIDIKNDLEISGIAIDSRDVKPGYLFIAYRGSQLSGVDYINDAIKSGAVAIAVDDAEEFDETSVTTFAVKIKDLQKQAGIIASRFYQNPSKSINVIGVTGTNGKTTVSYMIAHALSQLGEKAALIGTLGFGTLNSIEESNTTTPDVITLHALLSAWKERINTVAMEVSSHALDQGRVAGVMFNTAVFTNLSRDHLDYHKTIEEYAEAKSRLFYTEGLKQAVINITDAFGQQLIKELPDDLAINAYSTGECNNDIANKNVLMTYCEEINIKENKTELNINSPWGKVTITTGLLGQFNIENLLAAFVTLCASDIDSNKVAEALSSFTGVPGRMETFNSDNGALIVIDYAHTPDALEKALMSLRPYCKETLYCIFGCGGDRDKGKRAEMGKIAEALSDQVVLTNDNPRSEEPDGIVKDILAGISDQSRVITRLDRSDAITNTYLNANNEDVILIAGKGHETTQEIGETIFPFSDRELARRMTESET